jgi:hypothetical protein
VEESHSPNTEHAHLFVCIEWAYIQPALQPTQLLWLVYCRQLLDARLATQLFTSTVRPIIAQRYVANWQDRHNTCRLPPQQPAERIYYTIQRLISGEEAGALEARLNVPGAEWP